MLTIGEVCDISTIYSPLILRLKKIREMMVHVAFGFFPFQNYPDIDIHTILSKAMDLKRPKAVFPNSPRTQQRQKAGFNFKKR